MGTGTVLCMRAHHALPHGQRESKNPVDSTGVQKGRQSIMTKCNHNSDMGNKGGSFPYQKSCAVQEMASLTAEACLPGESQSGAISQKLPGLPRRSSVSAFQSIA